MKKLKEAAEKVTEKDIDNLIQCENVKGETKDDVSIPKSPLILS